MSTPRNGRMIVYTEQTPFETDVLRTNMYRMCDIAQLCQTLLGTGLSNATLVAGGTVTQSSPPALTVQVAPITIYQNQPYDATAYGVVPPDTTDILYKQGYNLPGTQLPVSGAMTGPTTPGNSVYYIVQAQFNTSDINPVSRPYFNSANPSAPIFITEPDTRQDSCTVELKRGSESSSPVIPTPDAGWVGLSSILIAFGQTTVVNANIAPLAGAPVITESLTQKISQATADARYAPIGSGVPTGSYFPFAGYTAPTGFLLTGGPTTVSRTTFAGLLAAVTMTQTGTTVSGTTNVTGLTSNTQMYPGMPLESVNFPSGTLVVTLVGTTGITTNNNATISSAISITFFPWGNGDGSTTFNIPTTAGLTIIGAGGNISTSAFALNMAGGINPMGYIGGEAAHTQITGEVGSHTHDAAFTGTPQEVNEAGATDNVLGAGGTAPDRTNYTPSGGVSISTTPAANPANVMQPSGVSNFIIKT
jgi:hypothetical protein